MRAAISGGLDSPFDAIRLSKIEGLELQRGATFGDRSYTTSAGAMIGRPYLANTRATSSISAGIFGATALNSLKNVSKFSPGVAMKSARAGTVLVFLKPCATFAEN